jgi:hypothetical protein
MFLFHVAVLSTRITAQVTVLKDKNISTKSASIFFGRLTLDEPVFSSFVVDIHEWLTLFHVIGGFVEHAVLESLTQNAQNRVVDKFVALPLLVGFEHAHLVVDIALVDGWNTTELLVVPGILFTVWFDNFFYGTENYAI